MAIQKTKDERFSVELTDGLLYDEDGRVYLLAWIEDREVRFYGQMAGGEPLQAPDA